MKQGGAPSQMVGNEFVVARSRPHLAAAAPPLGPTLAIPVIPDLRPQTHTITVHTTKKSRFALAISTVEFAHRYSTLVFALLFLAVGASGTLVYGNYRSVQIAERVPANFHIARPAQPIAGINMAVPAVKLALTLQSITAQSFTVPIGSRHTTVDADMIKSWLQVVTDRVTNTSYIHVNESTITASLQSIAKEYSTAPVNQVTVDHADGTGPQVINAGQNGLQVSVPDGLAQTIAKNLLAGKGMEAPLNATPLAFQAITPASFSKMIEVNVDTKQMYLYQNGQLYKIYAVSAGKPSTPTPIGTFHIFSKLPVEDMKGVNPNGTPYFQPHVHWINYFLPGGFAIHGVYWHGSGWFGNINSSHGCVGLPDTQAEEVYDWAPLGTTIITHHS